MFTKDKNRKVFLFSIIIILIFISIFNYGCNDLEKSDNAEVNQENFSVRFYNVGEADCAMIVFPDNKVMIIDTGDKDEKDYEKLSKDIKAKGGKIDYLLLTHTDGDHIGNALSIINDYKIERAYIPYICDLEKFPNYKEVYEALVDKNTELITSKIFNTIVGQNYYIEFLSPTQYGSFNSSYNNVNIVDEPTNKQVNNISPIVYISYCGVRFLFTGDAGESQEELVKEYNDLGFYNLDKKIGDISYINLTEIDFLKVSHHGASDGTCSEFAELVKPKNAVISVGGDNSYGHPSNETLCNLVNCNENINILRTDVRGRISVLINENGEYEISCGENL